MPNTPRMNWDYPGERDTPWFERLASFFNQQDTAAYAAREDRQLIFQGGGTISFNSTTGVLDWTSALEILAAVTGFQWRLAGPGQVTLDDGQLAYATLGRAPTLNQTITLTAASQVPNTDSALVFCVRRGTKVYFRNGVSVTAGTPITSISPGAGGGGVTDLQGAYDGGEIISLSDVNGAIEVNDSALTGAAPALKISKGAVDGAAIVVDNPNTSPFSALTATLASSDGDPNKPSRTLRIQTGEGGAGTGSGGAASGYIVIVAGKGGDETSGVGGGVGGEVTLTAGNGGADTTAGSGAKGGDVRLQAGDGGNPGFGNGGIGGDVHLDAGAEPLNGAVNGQIYLGGVNAQTISSGNAAASNNRGTTHLVRGPMFVYAPGTSPSPGDHGLQIYPQSSETQGTRKVELAIQLNDSDALAIGGNPAIVGVDGDPNGQVTAGDPGSLALCPNNGTIYKKTANPSTWVEVGAGGGGQPLSYTGAANETVTFASPGPLVVGGAQIDGSLTGTFTFRLLGEYTATGTTGTCELRLYDRGAPGAPTARVLRSTASITFGAAGATDSFDVVLTPVGAPGVGINQIHNVARNYELDIALVGSDGAGDVFRLYRGSIEVV